MLTCEAVEFHPGIPGVDGLSGDAGFEVTCTDPAVAEIRFTDTHIGEVETMHVCQSHLDLVAHEAATTPYLADLEVMGR